MPPKADASASDSDPNVLKGFEARDMKLLAAAFLSSTGPNQFDYDVMAGLTGNTAGSLRKMMPPVKRKAAELVPSFATFIGETPAAGGAAPAPAPAPAAAAPVKPARGRKRKGDADDGGDDSHDSKKVKTESDQDEAESAGTKKAAPKKRGRPVGSKNKKSASVAEKPAEGAVEDGAAPTEEDAEVI